MAAWVGAAAREPGDLDFVVVPHTLTSNSPEATRLFDDIKAAVRAGAGAGLEPDQITETAIWTYERADGRRLAIPFSAPGTADSGLVEGQEADSFTAASVLAWDVDWTNFTDEYPTVAGAAEQWALRLAVALDRSWS
jgi:hypothetical protein